MDALSCRGQRKGSNCSFLDLARHFVCFHFLLESSEWKTSCCFSWWSSLGDGYLVSSPVGCLSEGEETSHLWEFEKKRWFRLSRLSHLECVILLFFLRELSIISRSVSMYRGGQEMPHCYSLVWTVFLYSLSHAMRNHARLRVRITFDPGGSS